MLIGANGSAFFRDCTLYGWNGQISAMPPCEWEIPRHVAHLGNALLLFSPVL